MKHDDAIKTRGVPVAWRPPFAITQAPWVGVRPAGDSLLDMVKAVPDLPRGFLERGIVCVNGELVPHYCPITNIDLWAVTRPKPTRDELPIAVTLHYPLGRGGGGGGGGGGGTAKAVGSLVAALALVVVTGGIAGGAFPFLVNAGFTGGSIQALALSGVVGIGGALAISALSPPPSLKALDTGNLGAGALSSDNTDQRSPASAQGNSLSPGGPIPRVIGTRKVFFPLIGEPIVELVGDDEFVEAGFCGNGPHALDDIRIDNVAIADAPDVAFETREGWPDDSPVTLTQRQGRTLTPQITLSVHTVKSDNQDQLVDATHPVDDLPIWHGVASRNAPDEIWLHFLLNNGISVNGSTSTDVVVPLRIRIRKRGVTAWTNLPEIHLSDSTLQQRRRAVLLKFTAAIGVSTDTPPTKSGFVYANIAVPGQVTAPATTGWTADSYFVGASGASYLNAASMGAASKLRNLNLYDNRVEIALDPATFTPGVYEIQVMRGAAFLASSFTQSTYSYSASVKDFFTYASTSTPVIPMSRSNLADSMALVRVISIWNEHPVQKPGLALVCVKARNREVRNVSVLASGYVKDWDGSGWNTWITTSNPAPHYADILSGAQNIDPLPTDLRDDAGLVAWRTLCDDNGWTCDAIIDDFRTQDALSLLASCGYAKSYQSDIYGVTVDNDRSGDDPVQVFSRRNAANVRFERALARVPDGFIVNFSDSASDYDTAQTVVYQRDRTLTTTGLLETVTYDGLVDEAAVIARAQFDLDQANDRATFYYLDADIEALVCRRGNLVGLQHDVLTARAGDALIKSIVKSSGNITGFTLDSTIAVTNVVDMHATTDMHGVTDMHDVGVTTGIAIRRNDGTISTHLLSDATGETDSIHLETPLADPGTIEALDDTESQYGSMITAGALNSEYRRLLVQGMTFGKDLRATLTLVDEAPELVRYAA